MILKLIKSLGRAIVLVLSFWVASMSLTFAHALPGSVLTFSQQGQWLELSVSFSLDDLAIAAPKFEAWKALSIEENVSTESVVPLIDYFNAHLKLQRGSESLPVMKLITSLKTAKNGHVGSYISVVSKLSFSLPEGADVFPLTLTYDAVMHEVRTHRATVYWKQENVKLVRIVDFGFRQIDGVPKGYWLRKQ